MPNAATELAEVSLERRGQTALVTFQSPSLGRALQRDLWSVMNTLEAAPDIAVIVFTGRRNIFMTGADLTEVLALNDRASAIAFLELPHAIVKQFCESSKILIAAINGYCLGGGLELALTCDFRYAVNHVSDAESDNLPFIGFPEAELGLTPALGGAYFAREVLGLSRAKELLFGAARVDAQRALEIGLIHALFPRDALRDEVLLIADHICAHSASSLKLTKRLLHMHRQSPHLDEALTQTREAFADCCLAGDKDDRIRRMRAERVGRFREAVGAASAGGH